MDQPSESAHNQELFEELLANIDPNLWRIHMKLKETKVSPLYIPAIIDALAEVAMSTGHGEVNVYINQGLVNNVTATSRGKSVKLGIEVLEVKL